MSFYNTLKEEVNSIIKEKFLKNHNNDLFKMYQISEPPADKFGDVSTNAALALSNMLKKKPIDLANVIIFELKKIKYVNLFTNFLITVMEDLRT